MKKIILLVLGMIFLTNCGNNGNTNSNSVAVAPEKRESFTENPYFKSDKIFEEDRNKEIQYVRENEYNTLEEAIKNVKSYSKEGAKEIIKNHKDKIQKIEHNTKSKFYVYENSSLKVIYFSPIDKSIVDGEIGTIEFPLFSKIEIREDDKVLVPKLY